jgi:2-hydroxy-6-oxonona-2,4-dienedioate hydrolase
LSVLSTNAAAQHASPLPASGQDRTVRWSIPDSSGLAAEVRDLGWGSGNVPFVFLHGLVGLNEHWEDVAARIRTEARCILFELPLLKLRGSHCSIQGATDLTARFLREQLTEPAVLVGNSFGGHVAARLAIEYPQLVRGLVLTGASGVMEKSMVSDIQIRPSKDWLRRKIGELFFDQSHMREADLDRAYAELSDRLGERMRDIRVPTLLVWGKQDVVTPPEAAQGFARYIEDSRLVWFDQCGHAPMIEWPERFAAAVLEFAGKLRHKAARA